MAVSNNINRRTILTGVGSATVIAPPLALAASSRFISTPDPIISLYQQWKTACVEIDRQVRQRTNITDEEIDMLCAVVEGKSRKIRPLTATSLEGLACQIHLAWAELGPGCLEHSMHYAKEMEEPENILLKSILDGSRNLISV